MSGIINYSKEAFVLRHDQMIAANFRSRVGDPMALLPVSVEPHVLDDGEDFNIPIIRSVTDHLSYLGYEVAIEKTMCRATHQRKASFSFYMIKIEALRFMMFFKTKEHCKVNKEGFYRFVNQVNDRAIVSHFTINNDFSLMSNATYLGEYNKTTFASLLELWEEDTKDLLKYKASSDFV